MDLFFRDAFAFLVYLFCYEFLKKLLMKKAAFWALVCLSLFSCTDNDDADPVVEVPCTTDTIIPTESLQNLYGCVWTEILQTTIPNNTFVIVRSQAQYDALMVQPYACLPEIDFETYDMIIGKSFSGATPSYFTYEYKQICGNPVKQLKVLEFLGMGTTPRYHTYHALIPKLAPIETIDVERIVM
jgi:hypothetical protein